VRRRYVCCYAAIVSGKNACGVMRIHHDCYELYQAAVFHSLCRARCSSKAKLWSKVGYAAWVSRWSIYLLSFCAWPETLSYGQKL